MPANHPLQLSLDEIDAQSRIEPPVSHTPDLNQLPPGYSCHSWLPVILQRSISSCTTLNTKQAKMIFIHEIGHRRGQQISGPSAQYSPA